MSEANNCVLFKELNIEVSISMGETIEVHVKERREKY